MSVRFFSMLVLSTVLALPSAMAAKSFKIKKDLVVNAGQNTQISEILITNSFVPGEFIITDSTRTQRDIGVSILEQSLSDGTRGFPRGKYKNQGDGTHYSKMNAIPFTSPLKKGHPGVIAFVLQTSGYLPDENVDNGTIDLPDYNCWKAKCPLSPKKLEPTHYSAGFMNGTVAEFAYEDLQALLHGGTDKITGRVSNYKRLALYTRMYEASVTETSAPELTLDRAHSTSNRVVLNLSL